VPCLVRISCTDPYCRVACGDFASCVPRHTILVFDRPIWQCRCTSLTGSRYEAYSAPAAVAPRDPYLANQTGVGESNLCRLETYSLAQETLPESTLSSARTWQRRRKFYLVHASREELRWFGAAHQKPVRERRQVRQASGQSGRTHILPTSFLSQRSEETYVCAGSLVGYDAIHASSTLFFHCTPRRCESL